MNKLFGFGAHSLSVSSKSVRGGEEMRPSEPPGVREWMRKNGSLITAACPTQSHPSAAIPKLLTSLHRSSDETTMEVVES